MDERTSKHAITSGEETTRCISLVCPFYNESPVLNSFFDRIVPILASLTEDYEIVCVNDGSTDDTLAKLKQASEHLSTIRIVDLSRNFGKEAALSAGLSHALGDAVIVIDADLQDPPELIPKLVDAWRNGSEVVLAHRADRASDSFLKRMSARVFYGTIRLVADSPIPSDVGDFRLMDRKVVAAINSLPENRRFMKGLMSWVGYRTTVVEYVREPRSAGHSKFSGWRLWNLAVEGITAFSIVPLRIWSYLGLLISTAAFLYGSFIVFRTLIYGVDVPGYASLLTVTLFLGGIQLIGLGVMGEYVGRIYMESKRRPAYLVREIVESERVTNDA